MEAEIMRLRQKIDELEEKIIFLGETETAMREALMPYRERDLEISALLKGAGLSIGKASGSARVLAVCEKCKKIHEDFNRWSQLEEYMHRRFHLYISNDVCPECENINKTH